MKSGNRVQGTVSWFNEEKGFGFITGPDGRDVYVQFQEIQRKGFQTLNQGEAVTYEPAGDEVAPKAMAVRPVNPD